MSVYRKYSKGAAPKKQLLHSQKVAKLRMLDGVAKSVECYKKGFLLKAPAVPISVEGAITHHATLLKKVKLLDVKDPDQKAGWIKLPSATDVKVDSALEAELKSFTAFARQAIQSGIGMKAVHLVLPVTTSFQATVTTGTVNPILNVDVSQSPEWASIQALFDEYRFQDGVYKFVIVAPTQTVVLATSTIINNANFAIGFDPSDSSATTDVRDVVQLAQHVQKFPRMVQTPTIGTFVGVYGTADNEAMTFRWKLSPVALVINTSGSSAGTWKATGLGSFTDGFIKMYYRSGFTTALEAVNGTMYYHVEVRSRT